MNDDFLTQLQEAPRREFGDTLYTALERQGADTHRLSPAGMVAIGILAVLIPFAMALTVSPAVRAATQRVIRTIGGLPFDVTDEYPGREGPIETLESEQLSFAQAGAELPFALRLPAWAPDGYQLEDTVTITHLPDGSILATVTWHGNQNRLFLDIFSSAETLSREGGIAVGPDSVEEVLLRGRPAALVHGAWDANARAWGPGSLIGLHWTEDGQGYRLGGMAEHITAAELMGMAESMP